MKVTLDNSYDTELWVVTGIDWAIPVYVNSCTADDKERFYLRCAASINYEQAEILTAAILSVSESVQLENGWVIKKSELQRIAVRATGITPSRYLMWNGSKVSEHTDAVPVNMRVISKSVVKRNFENTFIPYVAMRTGIAYETLSLAWSAIIQCAGSWLLSGKEINMGEFRLAAVPFRKNWKELLFAKAPGLRTIFMMDPKDSDPKLLVADFSRFMRSTELTHAIRHSGECLLGWTIEVIHDSSWNAHIKEVELEEVTRYGRGGYIRRWGGKVTNLENTIKDILREAAQNADAAAARLHWPLGQGDWRIVVGAPVTLGVAPRMVSDSGGAESIDDISAGRPQIMDRQITRMLEMPYKGKAVDVRDTGGNNPN